MKCSFTKNMVVGSSPVAANEASDFAPASSKGVPDIKETMECGLTRKYLCDMIKIFNQMHRTDKYSQHSSIIWLFCLNG